MVDLGSHNTNPPRVFDGEAVPILDAADYTFDEAVAAIREFVKKYAMRPTAKTWTKAAMRPSEKTIRRRFGSFRKAIEFVGLDSARLFDDPPSRRHPVRTNFASWKP
jgi:hypothetical protein